MQASTIIESIRSQIGQIYSSHKLLLQNGKCTVKCLQYFNLPTAVIFDRFRLVRWVKPPHNCIKLNVDGASKNNPGEAGIGGLFRDSFGNLIIGFASYLGTT